MNGVAAEIAQEIGVFLEDHHLDSGARQQESEDRSRGTAPGNAAPNVAHTRVISGSRGMIIAHSAYSTKATGPVVRNANSHSKRTMVGSTST